MNGVKCAPKLRRGLAFLLALCLLAGLLPAGTAPAAAWVDNATEVDLDKYQFKGGKEKEIVRPAADNAYPSGFYLYLFEVKTADDKDAGTGHAVWFSVQYTRGGITRTVYEYQFRATAFMEDYGLGKSLTPESIRYCVLALPADASIQNLAIDVKQVGGYNSWEPEYIKIYQGSKADSKIGPVITDVNAHSEKVRIPTGFVPVYSVTSDLAKFKKDIKTYSEVPLNSYGAPDVSYQYVLEVATGYDGTEQNVQFDFYYKDNFTTGAVRLGKTVWLRDAAWAAYNTTEGKDPYVLRANSVTAVPLTMEFLREGPLDHIEVRCEKGDRDPWAPLSIRLVRADTTPTFYGNGAAGDTTASFRGLTVFEYNAATTRNNLFTWSTDELFALKPNSSDTRFNASFAQTRYDSTVQSYVAELYTADLPGADSWGKATLTVNYTTNQDEQRSANFDVQKMLTISYGHKKNGSWTELKEDYPPLLRNGRDAFVFTLAGCKEITGYTVSMEGKDNWGVQAVAFYKSNSSSPPTVKANFSQTLRAYEYTIGGAVPIGYDWAQTPVDLSAGGTHSGKLTPGAVDFNKLAYDGNTYVVEINTSSVDGSDSKHDVTFAFQYLDSSNQKVTSPSFNLRDLDNLFRYGERKEFLRGQTYYAVVKLQDVKSFLSMTLTLSGTKDQYQTQNIRVYRAAYIDRRVMINGEPNEKNGSYTRGFDTSALMVNYTRPVLLQDDHLQRTITLYTEETQPPAVQEPDLGEMLGDLTFADVESGLNLSVVKHVYQVKVNVAELEDAGSTNEFFFQLIFQGGTSGVVLANEQITGDAFRAGKSSVFYVNTNQNYGDLKAVRIICNVPDSGAAFDKANFSRIEVTRLSNASLMKSWVVGSIGWVDITYVDPESGASYSATEQAAQSSAAGMNRNISQDFPVSSITGAMRLLFTLTTKSETNAGTDNDVFMTVSYRQGDGSYQNSEELNLRDLVKEYTENSTKAFQKGSVDRFLYSFTDVTQLASVNLRVSGGDGWALDNITVNRVSGASDVYRSASGEYVRDYTKIEYITTASGATVDKDQSRTVSFQPNQGMDMPLDEITGEFVVDYEIPPPPDVEERINIFVMPMKGTLTDQLSVVLKYNTLYGSMPAQIAQKLPAGNQTATGGGLALLDIPVVNVGTIAGLAVSCDGRNAPGIAYALVQRVGRSEATGRFEDLKSTYYIPYNNYLSSPLYNTPAGSMTSETMRQVVTLTMPPPELDSVAEVPRITSQEDALISMQYRSSLDPDVIYQTPYRSLSAQGDLFLTPGSSLQVTFDEPFVQEILGISVKRSTGPDFTIHNVHMENHSQGQNGKTLLRSTASISTPFIVSTGERFTPSTSTENIDSVVAPVSIVFHTADNIYAPTLDPITMKVHYLNARSGAADTIEIYNLWQYVTGAVDANGNPCDYFTQNSKTTVSMMLSEVGTITGISLSVSNMDKWMLADVSVRRTLPNGSFEEGREEVNAWVETVPLFVDVRPGSMRDESAIYDEKEQSKQPPSSPGNLPTEDVETGAGDDPDEEELDGGEAGGESTGGEAAENEPGSVG